MTFLTAAGQFLSQIYGMDSVIINQLMYGIRGGEDGTSLTSGWVKNVETAERWGWHAAQLEQYERTPYGDWLARKLGAYIVKMIPMNCRYFLVFAFSRSSSFTPAPA